MTWSKTLMSVRIGINPLTWTNDDMPELGAETPLETCLSEGKQAGYSGFELGNKFPRSVAQLAPILEQHQLSLISGWFSGELLTRTLEEEIIAIEDHLTLLQQLGAKVMVYCEVTGCIHSDRETPISQRPVLQEDQWDTFTKRLNQLAKHCLSRGVRLAYHHHMGTVIQSEVDIDRLMAQTNDDLGLLLDTGHLTYAGADPIAVQQKHAKRICHVHCKDVRASVLNDVKNRNLSFLNAVLNGVFTVPGDGCIDYPTLFNELHASDYQGWLVVEAEQDPAVAHPLTYATMGATNLRALCTNAGINITH